MYTMLKNATHKNAKYNNYFAGYIQPEWQQHTV